MFPAASASRADSISARSSPGSDSGYRARSQASKARSIASGSMRSPVRSTCSVLCPSPYARSMRGSASKPRVSSIHSTTMEAMW